MLYLFFSVYLCKHLCINVWVFFNLSINILDLIFFILHLFDNKSEFTVLYLFHSSWNEQKRLRFYLFSLKHPDIYPRLRQIFHQQNNNYRTDKSLLALCKQSRSHSIRCNQRWSPDRKRKQKSISTSKGRFHVNCYLQGTKVAFVRHFLRQSVW